MRKPYSKYVFIVFLSLVLSASFILPLSADIGPKPAVYVDFLNMGEEECYATLLSKAPSTGPQSVWDGDEAHIYSDLDMDIWRAFVDYNDEDGFYFLQIAWKISESKKLDWDYYPPSPFKILLYYPGTNTFWVSDIYERYAFDSYFTVDMQNIQSKKLDSVEYDTSRSNNDRIEAYRSYNYREELIHLLIRILLTICIELLVALLFGIWERKQILFLALVNIGTQTLLNFLLNYFNYRSGPRAMVALYVLFEIVVFVIEVFLYRKFLNPFSKKQISGKKAVWYAFFANVISFVIGIFLVKYV